MRGIQNVSTFQLSLCPHTSTATHLQLGGEGAARRLSVNQLAVFAVFAESVPCPATCQNFNQYYNFKCSLRMYHTDVGECCNQDF